MTAPGPRFFLLRPSFTEMKAFAATQKDAASTYARLTSAEKDALFPVDRRAVIGRADELSKARAALLRWGQYPKGWTTVVSDHVPAQVGDVTCARLRHLRFWSLAACRVRAIEDERERFALEIETLEGHPEIGLERFELACEGGELSYRITSRSGPGHFLVRLGEPVMRHYQERFLRESPGALAASMRALDIRSVSP